MGILGKGLRDVGHSRNNESQAVKQDSTCSIWHSAIVSQLFLLVADQLCPAKNAAASPICCTKIRCTICSSSFSACCPGLSLHSQKSAGPALRLHYAHPGPPLPILLTRCMVCGATAQAVSKGLQAKSEHLSRCRSGWYVSCLRRPPPPPPRRPCEKSADVSRRHVETAKYQRRPKRVRF